MVEFSEVSRRTFAKAQIGISIPFVTLHWLAVQLGVWAPPETILAKFTLYFGVPLTLLSLYVTSIKRVFPQRMGDTIHISVLTLLISTFALSYAGSVGGVFVFLFFFLVAFSTLLLDAFIPLFIGGLVSLIVVVEFLLTVGFSHPSYTPLISTLLQVMALLSIGWLSSSLVKRTLAERKAAQELRKSYKELKKLDVAKSEFISIASHQLRTPLAVVKGYVARVLRGSYGAVPEKAKQPLESVYRSNERLIKLVDDLLSISRIETGKLEMKLSRISLEDVISSVANELKVRAEEKYLYLRWEKPRKALPKILVDEDKIRQALFNVVDNAIKYTKKGGVTIELARDNSSLLTTVADTGVGLTRKELAYLFESFSRGKAGVQFWPEGIGLGLYIARRLLEMHNGRIWAESKGEGKGSTFFIELPIK